MSYKQQQDDLHQAVNDLIIKHGAGNPELARELTRIQEQLLELARRKDDGGWAKKALQLAALIKFIWDNWP